MCLKHEHLRIEWSNFFSIEKNGLTSLFERSTSPRYGKNKNNFEKAPRMLASACKSECSYTQFRWAFRWKSSQLIITLIFFSNLTAL